jgi:V/A-type H+/Na+-transporting ATPase subunit I
MAMLQMQRIFIYALKKDRKPILELLQRRGVVEINDILPEDSVFHKTDVSHAKVSFEKNIASVKEAIGILNHYVPEKKSMLSALNGRKEVSAQVYEAFKDKYEATLHIVNRIIADSKQIAENKAEILKLQAQVDILTPWINLDIPLSFAGTKYTKSFLGTLSKEWTLEAIYEILADYMPVNVDIISASKEQTCIFVLCQKDKADKVFETLRANDFSYPSISSDKSPAEQLAYLKNQMKEAELAIEEAEKEIKAFEASREDILFLQDYETMRSEKYDVIGHLLQTKNVFVMSGFIPEKDSKSTMDELNGQFELLVETEEPKEEDDVPVLLKNNGFSGPLEGVLGGYSLPGKGEVDPTMVMSLFYYMLFGLMLSDAGYGALMAIGCAYGLIKFKKTLEPSMRNTLKMYLYCGISTVFWGAMFGSYFGDIVDVVSETFFGHKVTIPPLWFFPVNEPMRMLSFAMLVGLIHLLTGLGMKFYQLLRQHDFKSILYDVVSWFVLIVSSTILLLSMKMMKDILGISLTIPAVVANASGILAGLSAVAIVLTNGRESRNPFKRFLKGAYALYGITGYLSDVLSYSRLLALGLATGVIGSVINKMAAMTAGAPLGPLWFIIVVVGGHALNIAINALGAYVHTNRLQYVEFFGKFYEGGGRMFQPFGMKTKYYKVKEKM